ncbi:MAG TPA: hypothetical protein VF837_04515 [Patescibacteria group bacterium]
MKDAQFLSHPLVTNFQRKAWEYTYILEKAGYLKPVKAYTIRNKHLTVAWDPQIGKTVDLLSPRSPRDLVIQANQVSLQNSLAWLEKINKAGIHQTYSDSIPLEITSSERMKPYMSQFPEGQLINTEINIYGEPGDWSYWITQKDAGDHCIVAVSPDLYGLPTQLMNMHTKSFVLGIYPQEIGYAFVYALYEILAQEEHPGFIGVAGFITDIVNKAGFDAVPLAKAFVLGDVEPLYTALEIGGGRLAPALLTYISDEAGDTPISIARIKVMRALNLCGPK